MDNITLIGFVAMILLSRYINSKAIKQLTTEKKAELIDEFSNFGIWSMIPLFVIFLGAYLLIDSVEDNKIIYLSAFVIMAVAYIISLQVYIYKKLLKLEYPMSYIKQYILSVFVRFFGLSILMIPVVYSLF